MQTHRLTVSPNKPPTPQNALYYTTDLPEKEKTPTISAPDLRFSGPAGAATPPMCGRPAGLTRTRRARSVVPGVSGGGLGCPSVCLRLGRSNGAEVKPNERKAMSGPCVGDHRQFCEEDEIGGRRENGECRRMRSVTAILLYYLGTYVRLSHGSLGAQPST